MSTPFKCAVKDCENHSHQGKFVGLLCSPCHAFVSGDGGLYSQAYRNSRSMIDQAVAMEREACAKVCDEYAESSSDHEAGAALNIQAAIRARGQA